MRWGGRGGRIPGEGKDHTEMRKRKNGEIKMKPRRAEEGWIELLSQDWGCGVSVSQERRN